MKALSLKSKIEKLGGSAKIQPYGERGSMELVGELMGHDIHMIIGREGIGSFYTVRPISKRGEYDPTSDYNSGGYNFYRKIKHLEWVVAA